MYHVLINDHRLGLTIEETILLYGWTIRHARHDGLDLFLGIGPHGEQRGWVKRGGTHLATIEWNFPS